MFKLITTLLMLAVFPQFYGIAHADQDGREWNSKEISPPYEADSPWNLRIGPSPDYDSFSDELVDTLVKHFGCDPTQYAYTVYDRITSRTPTRDVEVTGVFSDVTGDGDLLNIRKDVIVSVPLLASPRTSRGTDSQIIVINSETGDEWGFWRFRDAGNGSFVARNGYHYNVNWSGVPPLGFNSRGAGVPYLAGLIRPGEIKRGRIDHALAFGSPDPSVLFVYPATKSDGDADFPALPEGARLQLDPELDETDFNRWGLSRAGKIIARALQEYGMILVDGSGHPKLYVEDHHTANWGGMLRADTVKPIPYSAFRVLDLGAPEQPPAPSKLQSKTSEGSVTIDWERSPSATRYRIVREDEKGERKDLKKWVVKTHFTDTSVQTGETYNYFVYAVSHNGVSEAGRIQVTASE